MPLMPTAAENFLKRWKNSRKIKKMGNDDGGRVCYNEDNPLIDGLLREAWAAGWKYGKKKRRMNRT